MLRTLKRAAKNVMFAFSQSNLMNIYNSTTHAEWQMTWWRGLYIALIIVFAVLAAAAIAMYIVSLNKRRN